MFQEKTSSSANRLIVEAEQANYDQLAAFLNQNNTIHRHLDWISTLDWLGHSPFLIELQNQRLQAVLCAAPENDEVAWVRVFGVRKNLVVEEHWQQLLSRAIQKLRDMNIGSLGALALHPWFETLLRDTGFINRQNIIVLEWKGEFPEKEPDSPEIQIRQMKREDLPAVTRIDSLAFPPLWQNSLKGLTKAIHQTGVSTVALDKGEIVGYQISTSMTIYGHLARLAVHPAHQRKGIAYTLVYDLLKQFKKRGIWQITVNTQSDNMPSLDLYEKFKFEETQEHFRVYQLALR